MNMSLKIVKEDETIGVIPVYEKETALSILRNDIEKDFNLKDFVFLRSGVPLDVSLEALTDIGTVEEEDTGFCVVKISLLEYSTQTSQPHPAPTISKEKAGQVASSSFLRSPTSWEIRGVKIYNKDEIGSAKGFERKRREFWNDMAKKLCKETSKSRAVIGKQINEAWRERQATLLLEEQDLRTRIDSQGLVRKSMKVDTLSKNADRIRQNKSILEATNAEIEATKRSDDGQKRKRKLEMLDEKKKFYLKDMKKAQDSMRKNLNVKLSDVNRLCEDM